jgi:DNA polymerase I-like protein with 3'-5' exonuclease and polymerase domains
VEHILSIRDFNKKLGVLATGIDRDGRMRTSYNIAGTDTGRLSSYSSSFGSGTNLQNITEELRRIFVADPGKKFAYIDLAQVQSRAVGAICWNLFSDGTYLDFCESGDLHTGVCMLTWKDMDWHGTGIEALTNPEWYKHNRALADAPFYRVDSYRQGSKKLGHGTNFLGSPRELSKQTRIPMSLIQQFQLSYFSGFPAIERWHKWLRAKLAKDGFITTATGRRRHFFGRRFEEETVKAAAAYEPQDIEAFLNQTGLLQLWRARLPSVEILIPVHDAILIQYDERREDELIPQILETIKVELPLMNNRSLIVPHDVAVGWNWGKYDKKNSGKNPDGMKDYSGHDERKRSKRVAPMDRKFRPVD